MIPRNGRSGNSGFSRKTWRGIRAALMVLVVFVCLSSLPAQAQHYEAEESDLTNPCGTLTAPLTGSFTPSPCTLTRDRRASDLSFAHNYYGGEQLIEYLDNWWETEFLPALKDLTKQLSSSKVKQSLDLTMARDASRILETRATIEKEKLEALRDKVVNDQIIIGEPPKMGIVAGQKLANNLTQQFKNELNQRPNSMSHTLSKGGPALDHLTKWDRYCNIFRDPKDNNGANGCKTDKPDMVSTRIIGIMDKSINNIVDGDINVEGFMLQDTIDFKNTSNQFAAFALLQNIIQHKPNLTIPKEAINSAAGRESILRQQHIEAVRNVAADVVASIMTRRAAMKLPDTPTMNLDIGSGALVSGCPAGGLAGYRRMHDMDSSFIGLIKAMKCQENAGAFTNSQHLGPPANHRALGPPVTNMSGSAISMNKGSCLGAFQFCPGGNLPQGCWPRHVSWGTAAGQAAGWPAGKVCTYGGHPIHSTEEFLRSPDAQVMAWIEFLQHQKVPLFGGTSGLQSIVGRKCSNGTTLNASGLLAAVHLGAAGAVKYFARTCDDRYMGANDGSATVMSYFLKFSGYDMSPVLSIVEGNYVDPDYPMMAGSGKKLAERIAEIRYKAGVPNSSIAGDEPSYNEIMQAMTKERFFDPEYFTRIREGKTSLQSEQSSIDSYISVQYQDIYQLQEQINALLAARAALKVNLDKKPNQVQSSPLQ